ncbi:MAG TPA: SRPBCC domain-containing protein [Actinokineospora sp.]|jgi:uncharacterized protein YndB with AHSA1/START domain|nr:SRPBCC domain-containing protein [Actinokineospora sp.]
MAENGTGALTITRLLDTTPKDAFDAWTSPARFSQWWGGAGFSAPVEKVELNAEVGGTWKATIVADADGSAYPFKGTYSVVDEPTKLVFTLEDDNHPDAPPESMTVTFTEKGDKTELVVHQDSNLDEETLAKAKEGWGGFFDALAEHVAK